MKLRKLRSPFWSLVAVVLLLALPLLGSAAPPGGGGAPRGGAPHGGAPAVHVGGGHAGGGFSGGSFRGRGPTVARAPRGGPAFRGPRGGAFRGPGPGYYPGGAYEEGWAPYYGPDFGAAIAGLIAALAIGTVLGALPPGAVAQEFGGQTYYFDGTNYYQPCYQGTELGYCVVPNPNG